MLKTGKKIVSVFMIVIMCLTMAPLQGFVELEWPELSKINLSDWFGSKASAANTVGGTVENIWWTLDLNTGELIIGGNGKMPEFGYMDTPWDPYFKQIKSIVVSYGITYISDNAFAELRRFTTISIPGSVTGIGGSAFQYATGMESIYLPASCTSMGFCCFNYCWSLTDVYYEGTASQFNDISMSYAGIGGFDALLDATKHYNYKYQYHNGPEEMDSIREKDPSKIEFIIKATDSDGKLITVPNAEVSLYLGDEKLATETSDVDGYVGFPKSKLAYLSDSAVNNISVYAEKDVGNNMFLMSGYNFNDINVSEMDEDGIILIENKQLRIELSLAYSSALKDHVDVETVCKDFMSKLYSLTGSRIKVERIKSTEYYNDFGVAMSGCNILAYNKEDTCCANLNGFWNGGHIWMYSNSFDSPTLCHEALHYLIGVYDEYCCGYEVENDSYDLDFDCSGSVYKDGYISVYWVDSDVAVKKAKKIKNKQYVNKYIDQNIEDLEVALKTYYNLTVDDIRREGDFYSVTDDNFLAFSNSVSEEKHMLIAKVMEEKGTYFVGEAFLRGIFQKPKPECAFGVMEDQDKSLKMSTEEDYNYLEDYDFDEKQKNPEVYTAQYYAQGRSVAKALDDELNKRVSNSGYAPTLDSAKHYAKEDFSYVDSSSVKNDIDDDFFEVYTITNEPVCELEFEKYNSGLRIKSNDCSDLSAKVIYNSGEKEQLEFDTTDDVYQVYINAYLTDIQQILICDNETKMYNEYNIESLSDELSDGMFVSSLATVTVDTKFDTSDIIIVSDNTRYRYNNLVSVSTPFNIFANNSDEELTAEFTQTVAFDSPVNLSTIKAFKIIDDDYIEINSWFSVGEDNLIYICFDYSGNGKYVLMAEPQADTVYSVVSDLSVSLLKNGYEKNVAITFNDENEFGSIAAYVIYYSQKSIVDKNSKDVSKVIVKPGEKQYNLFLTQDYGKVYFAVEVIGLDGGRSPLSEQVVFNVQPHDTNNDGMPDYWINKYGVESISDAPLTLQDQDGDGIINLKEYQLGTNPVNPDTDGDNVYDNMESHFKLDPLKAKTDGETDDYIVAYGTPDLSIIEHRPSIVGDEVICTLTNKTTGKAMRTNIYLYIDEDLTDIWEVNVDSESEITFSFPVEYLSQVKESLRIEVDESKITRDLDYSNNTFVYSPITELSFAEESITFVKGESVILIPETVPEGANSIYKWSKNGGSNISVSNGGVVTATEVGNAIITAETIDGLSASCTVYVIAFEGAEYIDFDSKLINNDTEVEITGYVGSGTDIAVPSTIGGLPVTSISSLGSKAVESITIPASVRTISSSAFNNLTSLKSISVNEDNSNYYSQNGILYSKDKTQLIRCPIDIENKVVSVLDGVIEIPEYAFYRTKIETVNLPGSLTTIKSNSFSSSEITSVTIPENAATIEKNSFSSCYYLEEVTYNATNAATGISYSFIFTMMKYSVFSSSSAIKTINIGPGVVNIPTGLFSYLTGVKTVNILGESNLASISQYAFHGSSNIEDVYYGRYYKYWKNVAVTTSGNSPITSAELHCLECDEHTWDVGVYTTVPTCVSTGVMFHVCEVCEKEQIVVAPIDDSNHVETEVRNKAEANCTTDGYTGDTYCTKCETKVLTGSTINAAGHSLEVVEKQEETCESIGWEEYSYCVNCDYTTYEEIAALGHNIIVDEAVAPTCTETGLTEGSHCSRCSDMTVEQEVIPAVGHNYNTTVTEPSCTEGGYTTYTCSVCSDSYKADEIVSLGHNGGIANCKDRAICETCGEAYGEVNADNHKNIVTDEPISATCSATGLTEGSHCDSCGEVIVAPVTVDKLAHTEEIISAVKATCTTAGLTEGKKCSVCGEVTVKQTGVEKLGHSMGNYTVTKQPTCTDKGTERADCSKCDHYETRSIAAKGHNYGDNGVCSNCGSDKTKDCSHLCHESGFMGFIWNIVQFFWKLFKMNPVCSCGAKHY